MEKIIAIFGGTFSPVHNEHLAIIRHTIKQLKPEKLIVVPTKIPPHKISTDILPSFHRVKMLKEALDGMKGVEIDEVELNNDEVGYTYNTLQYFKDKYPNHKLYYVVGADSLADFHLWKNPKTICSLARLFVVPRKGYQQDVHEAIQIAESKYGARITLSSYVGGNISSTDIYSYVQFGKDVSQFLTENVRRYIYDNNIYRDFADMVKQVEEHLPAKRINHTFNVCLMALTLAKKYKQSRAKAFVAGLLHDVGKYKDAEYGVYIGLERGFMQHYPQAVWHQFISAQMASEQFNITDEDVLNAIRYHSTARSDMSVLEKIIYVADYCERGRQFEGVGDARLAVELDLETGFLFCLEQNLKFIKRRGEVLCDLSEQALEWQKTVIEGESDGIKAVGRKHL